MNDIVESMLATMRHRVNHESAWKDQPFVVIKDGHAKYLSALQKTERLRELTEAGDISAAKPPGKLREIQATAGGGGGRLAWMNAANDKGYTAVSLRLDAANVFA